MTEVLIVAVHAGVNESCREANLRSSHCSQLVRHEIRFDMTLTPDGYVNRTVVCRGYCSLGMLRCSCSQTVGPDSPRDSGLLETHHKHHLEAAPV